LSYLTNKQTDRWKSTYPHWEQWTKPTAA